MSHLAKHFVEHVRRCSKGPSNNLKSSREINLKRLMRRRAHVYIARQLSERLGLSKELEKVFAKAIVEPDRWRRKNPRRRHHYSQPYMALEYIKEARRAYVKGDAPSCLRNLGIALHFVQDAFVPSPRTRGLRRIHIRLEGKLGSLKGLSASLREAIDEGFAMVTSSSITPPPRLIDDALSSVKWAYDEKEVLTRAARTSAMITAVVLGPKDPPSGLRERYAELKRRYDEGVSRAKRRALAASLASAVGGAALTLPSMGLGSLFFVFISSLIVFLIAFEVALRDGELYRRYHELKEEAEWFGIA
jgi:hypothetical protein